MNSRFESGKRSIKRAEKVRRRLIFPSDEDKVVKGDDSSSGNSSMETYDCLEEIDLREGEGSALLEEPTAKRLCLLDSPRPLYSTEWNTREGKLLSKLVSYDKLYLIRKLDELKQLLKHSIDGDIIAIANAKYEAIKRYLVEHLLEVAAETYSSPDKTSNKGKFEAVKAILKVWGYARSQRRRGELESGSRYGVPLQELAVLPDGTVLQLPVRHSTGMDSGFEADGEDEGRRTPPHGIPHLGPEVRPGERTPEGQVYRSTPTTTTPPPAPSTRRTKSTVKGHPPPPPVLSFDDSFSAFSKFQPPRFPQEEGSEASEPVSEGSLCDCNFCRLNSENEQCERASPAFPVQNLLHVFQSRDTSPDASGDASTNSSYSRADTSSASFSHIIASSPKESSSQEDVEQSLRHVTSLLVQSVKTPNVLGCHDDDRLSDSLRVLGTNSHTKLRPDMKDEVED